MEDKLYTVQICKVQDQFFHDKRNLIHWIHNDLCSGKYYWPFKKTDLDDKVFTLLIL